LAIKMFKWKGKRAHVCYAHESICNHTLKGHIIMQNVHKLRDESWAKDNNMVLNKTWWNNVMTVNSHIKGLVEKNQGSNN